MEYCNLSRPQINYPLIQDPSISAVLWLKKELATSRKYRSIELQTSTSIASPEDESNFLKHQGFRWSALLSTSSPILTQQRGKYATPGRQRMALNKKEAVTSVLAHSGLTHFPFLVLKVIKSGSSLFIGCFQKYAYRDSELIIFILISYSLPYLLSYF